MNNVFGIALELILTALGNISKPLHAFRDDLAYNIDVPRHTKVEVGPK